MTWRTVHCSDPEGDGLPAAPPLDEYDPAAERDRTDRPWTCNGPGPLLQEFLNDTGRRDIRTIEPCSDCAGGSHRGPLRIITLEQQAAAS